MKKFILTLVLVVTSLSASNANAGLIMSGLDDTCVGCTLSNLAGARYVNPNGTDLDGAVWIQDADAWRQMESQTIVESDFDGLNEFFLITSLFVSFDDTLVISNGNSVLFDASNYTIRNPWTKVVDVVSLTGALTFDSAKGLSFFVDNALGGATGVIWKGEVTSLESVRAVPAPSVIGLMGLCIAIICGLKRRRIKI